MADLFTSLATAAATHAIGRFRQPQTLRGRVEAVGATSTTVLLVGATATVEVHDAAGVTQHDHVLVEFRPDGVARIIEVLA